MATRKRNNIWLKVAIIAGIVLVIGLVIFLVEKLNGSEDPSPVYERPRDVLVPEQKENDSQAGQTDGDDSTEEKEPVPQYDGDDPNTAPNLTGALTYAKIMKTPNGDEMLVLRVNIDQFLSEGTCDLTIKNGDESVYEDSTAIIDSASTSTCTGFDVPVSEIRSGNMQIVIKLTSGDRTGVIDGEIKI